MTINGLDRRFAYRPSKEGQAGKYEAIRGKAKELARTINDLCPDGREKDKALARVEEAMFWANAGVARERDIMEDP